MVVARVACAAVGAVFLLLTVDAIIETGRVYLVHMPTLICGIGLLILSTQK